MEACLVTVPNNEAIVDFAFYKEGQIALLLKDKARISHGGSTSCRLIIFALSDLPFMLLDRYSNGTNQLSQHVFEVKRLDNTLMAALSVPCEICLRHIFETHCCRPVPNSSTGLFYMANAPNYLYLSCINTCSLYIRLQSCFSKSCMLD